MADYRAAQPSGPDRIDHHADDCWACALIRRAREAAR